MFVRLIKFSSKGQRSVVCIGVFFYLAEIAVLPIVPKEITIGFSASITFKIVN